jgi:hypothetical protein
MKNENSIVQKEDLRTRLSSPLEIKNYMTILGATFIDDNKFVLDGLECEVDREYEGVYFEKEIPKKIRNQLDMYGINYYGHIVFDLEALTLIHTMRNNEKIEECFDNNLYQARKQMLLRILQERKELEFNGSFGDFDKAVTPFLGSNFDADRFLDECVFSTTGYYKKDGYDNCLKFQWKAKEDPDTLYDIQIYGENKFNSTIMSKQPYDRFHQQVYHFASSGNQDGIIKFFYGNDICIEYDSEKNQIKEAANFNQKQTREATEFDKAKLLSIVKAFQDRKLSFEKEPEKEASTITTRQIGQATVNAPITAKNEAQQVENAKYIVKEGEQIRDGN